MRQRRAPRRRFEINSDNRGKRCCRSVEGKETRRGANECNTSRKGPRDGLRDKGDIDKGEGEQHGSS